MLGPNTGCEDTLLKSYPSLLVANPKRMTCSSSLPAPDRACRIYHLHTIHRDCHTTKFSHAFAEFGDRIGLLSYFFSLITFNFQFNIQFCFTVNEYFPDSRSIITQLPSVLTPVILLMSFKSWFASFISLPTASGR